MSVFWEIVIFAVGTLLGFLFTKFFYRPKVVIRYKDIMPRSEGSTGSEYISLVVANKGPLVASDCAVLISMPTIEAGDLLNKEHAEKNEDLPPYNQGRKKGNRVVGQYVDRKNFRRIMNESICWAMAGNPSKLDINPGSTGKIDVMKIQKKKEGGYYFIIPSEDGWTHLRTRIQARSFGGKILVCPTNSFPRLIRFHVVCSHPGPPRFVAHEQGLLHYINLIWNREKHFFE